MPDDKDIYPGKFDIDDLPPEDRLGFAEGRSKPYVPQLVNFTPPPRASDTKALPPPTRIRSEREMLDEMLVPSEWQVVNMIEGGWIYALTGHPGSGKTAIALLMAYLMAAPDIAPRQLGKLEVEPGRVLFLAGENPTDVTRRMKALRIEHSLLAEAKLSVIAGAFSIEAMLAEIKADWQVRGPARLIIVDTAAAFAAMNGVTDENTNGEMTRYAQTLRTLTELPGRPAVLVLCHPPKAAVEREQIVPRGGGGFNAAIDCNFALVVPEKGTVELHTTTKLRGPGFEPMTFKLKPITCSAFDDTKGRPGWSVVASYLDDSARAMQAGGIADGKKKILAALRLAGDGGLIHKDLIAITELAPSTISEHIAKLKGDRLVESDPVDKTTLRLTPSGKKVAEKL